MLKKFLTHILLEPDVNGNNTGGSPVKTRPEGEADQDRLGALGEDASLDDAASAAIQSLTESVSPTDEKKEGVEEEETEEGKEEQVDENNDDESGDVKSLNTTDKDGDDKPSDEKDKDGKDKEEKTEDSTDEEKDKNVPFSNHPRWKEVLAERDTARNEVAQFKQEIEQSRPVVEAHRSVVDFCKQSGISDTAYRETLEVRALMNTDPAKALEKLLPIVESLQALTGKGIAPDLLTKVKDGILDEDSAREITQHRANQQRQQAMQQQSVQHQQNQLLGQMQQAVGSWFAAKKTSDVSFSQKEALLNGQFKLILDQTPPKSVADVTAALEKAYETVNSQLKTFLPKPKPIKAPIRSTTSRAAAKQPKNLDEFANELIEQASSGERLTMSED